MYGKYLENVRIISPTVHNITNFVTANDCANILIAAGASPIMANEPKEMRDICAISNGLNINLGTINKTTASSMILAGRFSNKLSNPVVLDLVGIGASSFRKYITKTLIEKVKFSVIKGNISEINTLSFNKKTLTGVDAKSTDKITKDNLNEKIKIIKKLSKSLDAIIVVSGEVDIITDGDSTFLIENGHAMMADVSGSGCMLSSLITAFISANKKNMLDATAAAVFTMGIAGEISYKRMDNLDGSSSYRNYLIDAIYNMKPEIIDKNAKYEII